MKMTGYKCFACGKTQSASFDGSVCPSCAGNLDVTYDYSLPAGSLPFSTERDDMFRYAPLLPIKDLKLAPPLRIGHTPLYRADRLGATAGLHHLYVKDDGMNPSASFKDRAGAIALVRARELGARVIAGATTGNAGSSMACLAASVGQPCVIFLPETAPPAKIAQLLVFGAHVMAVRGSYDDAFDLCIKICEHHGWFNRNTGTNPFTREGKKTCSYEIWEQLGRQAPDRIVVPTGDGNIISGIWKGMRDLHALGLIDRLPKIDCAQAQGSSAISNTVLSLRRSTTKPAQIKWSDVHIDPVKSTTLADSISVDLPRDGLAGVRAVIESGGETVTVSDDAIIAAIPELARMSGVFAEPAAATAWAGLKKLALDGRVEKDERVVCLITGNGLKDIAGARRSVGEPSRIDPTVTSADEALHRLGLV